MEGSWFGASFSPKVVLGPDHRVDAKALPDEQGPSRGTQPYASSTLLARPQGPLHIRPFLIHSRSPLHVSLLC